MSNRVFILVASLILTGIVSISFLLFFSFSRKAQSPKQDSVATDIFGVSFSPESDSAKDFSAFFEKAEQAGALLTWAGPCSDLRAKDGAGYAIAQLARQHALEPIMITDLADEELKTTADRDECRENILRFVKEFQPRYLGIGNEINRHSPTTTPTRLAFYEDVRQSVKNASSATKVFTVLQYETLAGDQSGLFGRTNDQAAAQWSLLDSLSNFDLIALTSYPGLLYKHPNDLPDNYWGALADHTDQSVAFTELGWFRDGPAGWESSAEEQADFIERLPELTSGLQPEFMIWPFLYDQAGAPSPFSSMGLLKQGETSSAAWNAWLEQIES